MKLQSILIGIIALATSAYFLLTLQPQAKDNSILVVGTSADFYPFCFRNEEGDIAGYDIDVISQVAQILNKKIKFVDSPFNTLIIELLGGHIDLIAASATPTQERKKHVLFTDTYMPTDPLVAVSKHPIHSLDEILHKHIITCTGYTADMYISEQNPHHEIIRLKNPSEALLALQSHAGDVFITAKNPVQNFLHAHPEYYVWEIPNTGEASSFALQMNNKDLCDQINNALKKMKNDGSLQALLETWKIS